MNGSGADHVAYALAMEEIAAGDVGTSTAMSVNNSLVCAGLMGAGSEEQKERFLRPLARGDMLGCFCLTEPQAGSDASALRSRAVPDGNGYRLSGTKQFVSSGSKADLALVFAVTDPDAGKKGISCFLVPTESEGYRVASHETKMGQRAHDTCQIVFEDVRLTPISCWASRDKATPSRSATSKAAASASPPRPPAPCARPTRPRSLMPRNARASASC